jgi:hypothetical protein
VGNWLSKDPIGIRGGLNQYVAFNNNPVNVRDPLGLWNLWNSATWGVANGVGWSWRDSINPFHESAGWSGAFWGASEGAVAFFDVLIPFTDFEYIYADECGNVPKHMVASRLCSRVAILAYSMRITSGATEWAFNQMGSGYTYQSLPAATQTGLDLVLRGQVLQAVGGQAVGGTLEALWTGYDISQGWGMVSDAYLLTQ